ncbi:ParB/RepB/Spo0J family partition protein [Propionibacterium australiense]|uniref:ParB/RepB/Spo0J family partition protein n=1 Tax=Propionibacterium australiense TaxID=119981 RepID=A0A8B3FII2_9ACTN|nr:ParB/RepB/Spo0J family partition protein [Propionibacterium australiense]RLP08605.1 ParB/RepB/Spo0J family partition protein [Propionibacterium australiense]
MSARQGGLGRGLGELFQRTDLPSTAPAGGQTIGGEQDAVAATMPDGSYFAEIPVGSVRPNPRQPRQVFSEEELTELSESIKEVGLLQPIVVRRSGDEGFELVMGERRLRAHEQAGIELIPAIVRNTDDSTMLTDALLENLHRVQLNPLEEAAAYEQLMRDFDITQEQLSVRIKKSRPHISNTIRLLRLPATVQRRVAAGILSAGHARALLALEDPLSVEELAQRIVAEGLSVRATEEIVTLATGQGEKKAVRTRRARTPNPKAESIAHDLADRFDTRVKVTIGRSKGSITIDFAGEDDLERILGILGN